MGCLIEDTHLNAYSVVLSAKRKLFAERYKSFLYISPDHAYYKKCKAGKPSLLISHITKEKISDSELLLMPVHVDSHWCLLVCLIKEGRWNFYDSLPCNRRLSILPGLIKSLHEDAMDAFPPTFSDWKVTVIKEAPKQENGHDCGVFVLKYMEAALSTKEFSWKECKKWQADMPRFRAQIAAEILQTFNSLMNDKDNS